MHRIAFVLSSALVLAACSTTRENVTPEVRTATANPTSQPSTSGSSSSTGVNSGNPGGTAVTPMAGMPTKRAIYFDFDSNAIKDEFTSVVQAHAKYLNDNKASRLRVEGNTDERGSREYNLALGQRRSDAVRRSLNVLGVAESRIETVSYGEEKPAAPGHDEGAWSQNRRADLKYDGK